MQNVRACLCVLPPRTILSCAQCRRVYVLGHECMDVSRVISSVPDSFTIHNVRLLLVIFLARPLLISCDTILSVASG